MSLSLFICILLSLVLSGECYRRVTYGDYAECMMKGGNNCFVWQRGRSDQVCNPVMAEPDVSDKAYSTYGQESSSELTAATDAAAVIQVDYMDEDEIPGEKLFYQTKHLAPHYVDRPDEPESRQQGPKHVITNRRIAGTKAKSTLNTDFVGSFAPSCPKSDGVEEQHTPAFLCGFPNTVYIEGFDNPLPNLPGKNIMYAVPNFCTYDVFYAKGVEKQRFHPQKQLFPFYITEGGGIIDKKYWLKYNGIIIPYRVFQASGDESEPLSNQLVVKNSGNMPSDSTMKKKVMDVNTAHMKVLINPRLRFCIMREDKCVTHVMSMCSDSDQPVRLVSGFTNRLLNELATPRGTQNFNTENQILKVSPAMSKTEVCKQTTFWDVMNKAAFCS